MANRGHCWRSGWPWGCAERGQTGPGAGAGPEGRPGARGDLYFSFLSRTSPCDPLLLCPGPEDSSQGTGSPACSKRGRLSWLRPWAAGGGGAGGGAGPLQRGEALASTLREIAAPTPTVPRGRMWSCSRLRPRTAAMGTNLQEPGGPKGSSPGPGVWDLTAGPATSAPALPAAAHTGERGSHSLLQHPLPA